VIDAAANLRYAQRPNSAGYNLLMPASVVIVHDLPEFLASAASALRDASYGVTCHCSPLAVIDDVEAGAKIDVPVTGVAFPPGSPHGISLTHSFERGGAGSRSC